jgi:hypothetical protein
VKGKTSKQDVQERLVHLYPVYSVTFASPDLDLSGYTFSGADFDDALASARGFIHNFFRDRNVEPVIVVHDEPAKSRREVWANPEPVRVPRDRHEVVL